MAVSMWSIYPVPFLAVLAPFIPEASSSSLREVVVGDVRVQALTEHLLRVEPRGPHGFEDRNTLMVASRNFSGIAMTKSTTANGTLLSTSSYNILIRSNKIPSGTCSQPVSMDVEGAVRSVAYPDGAKWAHSSGQCCDACGADPTCIAWVFVKSFGGCYPLSDYSSTVHSSGHDFGGPGKSCAATQTADVIGAVRSQKYTDGTHGGPLNAANAGECCDHCKSDDTCVAYVFVESFKGCYPLASYTGTKYSPGHTFAAISQAFDGPSFQVTTPKGEVVYDTEHDLRSSRLHWPSPKGKPAYGIMDKPRFFVPTWGAAPIPPGEHVNESLRQNNGYDWGNQVDGDTYVFLLGSDLTSYEAARKDFVDLTGPTPMLPDYAYGTWFTWWHPYDRASAQADIEQWETLGLPLDIWGLDINWRGVNWVPNPPPGHIYNPSTTCDYDHPEDWIGDEWLQWLKSRNLRTYFNDHPCAQAPQANPKEVEYRYMGLTKWFGKGLTFWWYDQNWNLNNGEPPPFATKPAWNGGDWNGWEGLTAAAWGSHVYWTDTKYYDESIRAPKGDTWYGGTMALSKSFTPDWLPGMHPEQGAEHPSHHRYPVHWTGDNVNLQASVESMVDAGVHSFKPYVHSDCGGDDGSGDPDVNSDGGLMRWTAHCAYGSILRFHGADHRAWRKSQAVQTTVKNYLVARHKLIPTIKAAAKKASETGHPLVARLDLFWPEYEESASNWQYLFLDDILVAPIFDSRTSSRSVWIPPGQWQDAWDPSQIVTGPKTMQANQPNERIPMWHKRDGGLLVLAHNTTTRVETQDWSSLSIEAFPCSGRCISRRKVVESRGSTDVVMTTDGNGNVVVQIGPVPTERAWVVRLNLRPMETLTSASIDGTVVRSVSKLHLAPNGKDYFPLMGAHSAPPPGAGLVAELILSAASHARSVRAVISSHDNVLI